MYSNNVLSAPKQLPLLGLGIWLHPHAFLGHVNLQNLAHGTLLQRLHAHRKEEPAELCVLVPLKYLSGNQSPYTRGV